MRAAAERGPPSPRGRAVGDIARAGGVPQSGVNADRRASGNRHAESRLVPPLGILPAISLPVDNSGSPGRRQPRCSGPSGSFPKPQPGFFSPRRGRRSPPCTCQSRLLACASPCASSSVAARAAAVRDALVSCGRAVGGDYTPRGRRSPNPAPTLLPCEQTRIVTSKIDFSRHWESRRQFHCRSTQFRQSTPTPTALLRSFGQFPETPTGILLPPARAALTPLHMSIAVASLRQPLLFFLRCRKGSCRARRPRAARQGRRRGLHPARAAFPNPAPTLPCEQTRIVTSKIDFSRHRESCRQFHCRSTIPAVHADANRVAPVLRAVSPDPNPASTIHGKTAT